MIGFALSWLIGRSITRPLAGLGDAMKSLAGGNLDVNVPAARALGRDDGLVGHVAEFGAAGGQGDRYVAEAFAFDH